ncbi:MULTISPECIES: hypothetical protein [Streptomyces]|uniref:Uncharacterized protein n=2 Tax=Streptomyces TaxID=1883 RepID=A0ABU4KCZ4_9ACTN|nr:hypothetical protein [Streptomyces roseolus]MDX2295656.1 hypothetical protein [Streptomyces roseolus]
MADQQNEVVVTDENGITFRLPRLPEKLPDLDPKGTGRLRRALQDNPRVNLSDEAIEAAAGLFADPTRVARLATHHDGLDGLTPQPTGSVTLLVLEGMAYAGALLPVLGNPRIAHLSQGTPLAGPHPSGDSTPSAPAASGTYAPDGTTPRAQLTVGYDSVEDARRLVEATVIETLKQPGADYSDSILVNGVMTPVEAVLVEVTYADGSTPVVVPALYDGTSRCTSAAKTRQASSAYTAEDLRGEVAKTFAEALTLSARTRRTRYAKRAQSVNAALERGNLTMPALRDRMTQLVPVRLVVGAEFDSGSSDSTLPDAIATAQSAKHISVNPWSEAAQDLMTAERIVSHLRRQGLVPGAFVDLVNEEILEDGQVALLFGEGSSDLVRYQDSGWVAPLWRAAKITHTLTRPAVFEEAKRFVRSDRGLNSVRTERYAGYLGVVIDMSFRFYKPQTTPVARRAWRDGGVLSRDVLGAWDLVVASAEELRVRALKGDTDARLTLQVLAGTALIADGLVTPSSGLKVSGGRVPYRTSPPLLLEQLLRVPRGVRQAEAVLRRFDPDRPGGIGKHARYTYVRVDHRGQAEQDGAGTAELTEADLHWQADPERSLQERAAREREKAAESRAETQEERNHRRRTYLSRALGEAQRTLDELLAQQDQYPHHGLREHPFGRRADWDQVRAAVRRIEDTLIDGRPPVGSSVSSPEEGIE